MNRYGHKSEPFPNGELSGLVTLLAKESSESDVLINFNPVGGSASIEQ